MGLELCSVKHTEVAYDSYGNNGCPVCEMRDEKQSEIDEMTEERDVMETEKTAVEVELIEATAAHQDLLDLVADKAPQVLI